MRMHEHLHIFTFFRIGDFVVQEPMVIVHAHA
jgi:hypothetical protein